MYAEVRETYGRIDVLFNNAGISPTDDGSVVDTVLDVWERVQAVNLRSVFLGCKYGIRALRRAGGGSIINVAIVCGDRGRGHTAASLHCQQGRRAGNDPRTWR